MKRLSHQSLAALAALLLGASNANLHAATFSDDNWTSMNSGIPGPDEPVSSMVVDGSGNLHLGGWFTAVGDVVAHHIARWNGSSWSPLGSGMSQDVSALAVSGSDLYVGGGFEKAGGKISPHLARARIGSKAQALTASNGAATLRFSGVTGYAYDVQRTTSLTPPITWTTVTTTPLYPAANGSFTFIDATAPPGSAYYRAQLTDSDL